MKPPADFWIGVTAGIVLGVILGFLAGAWFAVQFITAGRG